MNRFSLLPKKKEIDIYARAVIIFAVVFVVLLFVISIFGGWYFFIRKNVSKLQENLEELQEQEREVSKISYVLVKSKQAAFNKLSGERILWSEIFGVIDNNTLNDVSYLSFRNEAEGQKILLKAQATNYEKAADQLEMFRKLEDFQDVQIANVYYEEKKQRVVFDLSLIF